MTNRIAALGVLSLLLILPVQGSTAGPVPGTFVTVSGDNPYATGFDKIASVDTPDPLTVAYHLREPYAPFRDQVMGAAIVPKHVLGGLAGDQINRAPFNQKPVGTGPFTVSEFVTDDHVTLTANPRYWGKRAKLARIVVRIVPDQNAQVNLLRAGDLSVLNV